MLEFLPEEVRRSLTSVQQSELCEIRLRQNAPLFISVNGKYSFIPYSNGYVFTKNELEKTIIKLTDRTLYAHNDTIKKGYVCGKNGERVGLCGTCVSAETGISTIRDISSLCIRIPHSVKGCSENIVSQLYSNKLPSVLIVSPPGMGKTTVLRDIIVTLSEKYFYNILVVDERLEISQCEGVNEQLAKTIDILKGCSKAYGLSVGVRTLKPDMVAVDELTEETDIFGVQNAVLSGVSVLASAHAKSVFDLKGKQMFKPIFENRIFDFAVVLSSRYIGKIEQIISLKNGN